jgi:hypothetical protein
MDTRKVGERPHSIQPLPPGVTEYVLELIGAVEWLITIINTAVISISRGKICGVPFEMSYDEPGSPDEIRDPVQTPDGDVSSLAQQQDRENDVSILTRANAGRQMFTTLWRNGSTEKMLLQALRESGSVAVLLFKSLAHLTIATEAVQTGRADYDKIHQHYMTFVTLIKLWRSTFGTFDSTAATYSQLHLVSFCSNDADLAILQFYEIARSLEIRLAQQPSTTAKEHLCSTLQSTSTYRMEQRIESAMQISILASISQGVSRPGFQGENGLKAHIQDIGAHPVSYAFYHAVLYSAYFPLSMLTWWCWRTHSLRRHLQMSCMT